MIRYWKHRFLEKSFLELLSKGGHECFVQRVENCEDWHYCTLVDSALPLFQYETHVPLCKITVPSYRNPCFRGSSFKVLHNVKGWFSWDMKGVVK